MLAESGQISLMILIADDEATADDATADDANAGDDNMMMMVTLVMII